MFKKWMCSSLDRAFLCEPHSACYFIIHHDLRESLKGQGLAVTGYCGRVPSGLLWEGPDRSGGRGGLASRPPPTAAVSAWGRVFIHPGGPIWRRRPSVVGQPRRSRPRQNSKADFSQHSKLLSEITEMPVSEKWVDKSTRGNSTVRQRGKASAPAATWADLGNRARWGSRSQQPSQPVLPLVGNIQNSSP